MANISLHERIGTIQTRLVLIQTEITGMTGNTRSNGGQQTPNAPRMEQERIVFAPGVRRLDHGRFTSVGRDQSIYQDSIVSHYGDSGSTTVHVDSITIVCQ